MSLSMHLKRNINSSMITMLFVTFLLEFLKIKSSYTCGDYCDLMQMKERADKLEYWRMREKKIEEAKIEKKQLLRKQSSKWVDESEVHSVTLDKLHDNRHDGVGFPNWM